MSLNLDDVVYETDDFWVLRVDKGFEVYAEGITHSTRCAQIGYTGERGEKQAIAEADRRQALKQQKEVSHG